MGSALKKELEEALRIGALMSEEDPDTAVAALDLSTEAASPYVAHQTSQTTGPATTLGERDTEVPSELHENMTRLLAEGTLARFLSHDQFGGNLVYFLFFSGSCFCLSLLFVCFLFLWLLLVLFLLVWLLFSVCCCWCCCFVVFVVVFLLLFSCCSFLVVFFLLSSCCCCCCYCSYLPHNTLPK